MNDVVGQQCPQLLVQLDQQGIPAAVARNPASPAVGDADEHPSQRVRVLAGVIRYVQSVEKRVCMVIRIHLRLLAVHASITASLSAARSSPVYTTVAEADFPEAVPQPALAVRSASGDARSVVQLARCVLLG